MCDCHVCMCFVCSLQVHCTLSVSDVHVSFLPLAHMFERVVQVCLRSFSQHFFSVLKVNDLHYFIQIHALILCRFLEGFVSVVFS